MTRTIIPRRLWHETKDGRVFLEQANLVSRKEPLIVLGEAGMGKTELLKWLASQEGYAYCTARQMKNIKPDPRRLLGDATTLVIDALDELERKT
jgi:ABC-type nitrate/sulfonate/bicarbonate transport system ATPase subunit